MPDKYRMDPACKLPKTIPEMDAYSVIIPSSSFSSFYHYSLCSTVQKSIMYVRALPCCSHELQISPDPKDNETRSIRSASLALGLCLKSY